MPLYLLEPVRARLADPAWSTSAHRSFCLVAARSEGQARELAARALTHADGGPVEADAIRPPPAALKVRSGFPAPWPAEGVAAPRMPSPWLQVRLVEAREMPLAALADPEATLADGAEPRIVLPGGPPKPPPARSHAAPAGAASATKPAPSSPARSAEGSAKRRPATARKATTASRGTAARGRKARPVAAPARRRAAAKPAASASKARSGLRKGAKAQSPGRVTRTQAARASKPKVRAAVAARAGTAKRSARAKPAPPRPSSRRKGRVRRTRA